MQLTDRNNKHTNQQNQRQRNFDIPSVTLIYIGTEKQFLVHQTNFQFCTLVQWRLGHQTQETCQRWAIGSNVTNLPYKIRGFLSLYMCWKVIFHNRPTTDGSINELSELCCPLKMCLPLACPLLTDCRLDG